MILMESVDNVEIIKWVNVDNLNVRDCPSLGCKVIFKLKKGDKVYVVETKNNWSKVNLPDRDIYDVWVYSKYLSDKNELDKYWVVDRKVERRVCPSKECGSVGRQFYGEVVNVYEIKNGWARISKRYKALCDNGINLYVEKGNNECTERNGVKAGLMAEWVPVASISTSKPQDFSLSAKGNEILVIGSDDFDLYREVFSSVAVELIENKTCSRKEIGPWIKSTNYRDEPIYFMWCGNKKIYLNAETKKIFVK